jgi:hypothetical protein
VLFIGAGASLGARAGIAPPPPVGTKLIAYLERCFPTFKVWKQNPIPYGGGGGDADEDARLETFFAEQRQRDNQNYEAAINEMMRKDDDNLQPLLFALNRLLAFSFSHGNNNQCHREFLPLEDRYDLLIRRLGVDSGWRIISLNYDTLFEDALERQALKYVYPGLTMGVHPASGSWADAVPVYKVHGSCNWFVPGSAEASYGTAQPPFNPRKVNHGDFFDEAGLVGVSIADTYDVKTSGVCGQLSSIGPKHPVMAHFCKYKPALLNYRALAQIRRECLVGLKNLERAAVIGVRPVKAEDDTAVTDILERLPGACTECINPSEEDARVMRERYGFEIKRWTLEEWLARSALGVDPV